MDEMTCPKCQGAMAEVSYGSISAQRCGACEGLFLDRASLGSLIEAENDWHSHQSANTAALPRIDFNAPPPVAPRSRAFIETLFKT